MFFIRWVPCRMYRTKRSPNRKPYVKHPADPDAPALVFKTRSAAEAFVRRHPGIEFMVVESPAFWRLRDPVTAEEWQELAEFLHESSGEELRAQTALADELLAELED